MTLTKQSLADYGPFVKCSAAPTKSQQRLQKEKLCALRGRVRMAGSLGLPRHLVNASFVPSTGHRHCLGPVGVGFPISLIKHVANAAARGVLVFTNAASFAKCQKVCSDFSGHLVANMDHHGKAGSVSLRVFEFYR